MIKRLIFSAMLMCGLQAVAQSEVGRFSIYPRVGVALSNVSNMQLNTVLDGNTQEIDSKFSPGLAFGAEVEYRATDQLSLTVGALYTQLGCRYPDFSQDVSGSDGGKLSGVSKARFQLHYINVPILLNGYLAEGLAVKAGVQIGWLVDANYRWSDTDITVETGDAGLPKYTNGATTDYRRNIKDAVNKLDMSIPVGISYEYMNVVLDARYNYGLLKTFKSGYFKGTHNRYFTLTLGYKFDL